MHRKVLRRKEKLRGLGARVTERTRDTSNFIHITHMDKMQEYNAILDRVISISNIRWFENGLCGDGAWLLDAAVIDNKRMKKPYTVRLHINDKGILTSEVRLNAAIFKRYDSNLGDKSSGVINVIIRALCEHFAKCKICIFTTYLQKEKCKEATIRASFDEFKSLEKMWGTRINLEGVRKHKRDFVKLIEKIEFNGWFSPYVCLLRIIAGSAAKDVQYRPKPDTRSIATAYTIDVRTLYTRRGKPQIARKPKHDKTQGKFAVSFKDRVEYFGNA